MIVGSHNHENASFCHSTHLDGKNVIKVSRVNDSVWGLPLKELSSQHICKNRIKKEKEESHPKYTKKRKFVCGVVATKRKSSFVVFLENGALF